MPIEWEGLPSRRCGFSETEDVRACRTELPCIAQSLHRATRLKVRVDLNQRLGPVFLGRVLRVYKGADVVRLDAREAPREICVLIDEVLAEIKDVQLFIPSVRHLRQRSQCNKLYLSDYKSDSIHCEKPDCQALSTPNDFCGSEHTQPGGMCHLRAQASRLQSLLD